MGVSLIGWCFDDLCKGIFKAWKSWGILQCAMHHSTKTPSWDIDVPFDKLNIYLKLKCPLVWQKPPHANIYLYNDTNLNRVSCHLIFFNRPWYGLDFYKIKSYIPTLHHHHQLNLMTLCNIGSHTHIHQCGCAKIDYA